VSLLDSARDRLLREAITCSEDDDVQRHARKARTLITIVEYRIQQAADQLEGDRDEVADELRTLAGTFDVDAPDDES
jgi:hypothetical protein